jgi:lipoprotein-anchoring transpeptidase ErfK/SrfK
LLIGIAIRFRGLWKVLNFMLSVYRRVLLLIAMPILAIYLASGAGAAPREVSLSLGYPAGSIVIVNNERNLYFVLGNGRALRYRVAVGTRKELWIGRTFVSNMRKNPTWTPVDGGATVRGGISSNPLGRRAIYLDWSLLRIHGTPSRRSIGRAASNGCIRMFNEDVIDLYKRVHIGAPVVAINKRADAALFVEPKVSGKLPAYSKIAKKSR